MPSLNFVLPHWLYWAGLGLFPLIAMWMVHRERVHGIGRWPSLPIAYLLWLTGGFVGLHRYYLRSLLGLIYVPLFLGILAGNVINREARLDVSTARNDVLVAQFRLERAEKRQGPQSQAAGTARQNLEAAQSEQRRAAAESDRADLIAGGFAGVVAILLIFDALAMPGLARRKSNGTSQPPPRTSSTGPSRDGDEIIPPMPHSPRKRVIWAIDRLNGFTGRFVAYWSVIAVFVYYYEVIARYVFNSPTNWAHESMFLMFGMQYLLGGAYALREDSHVRVDVLYQYLPRRGQAVLDLITSVFFFIFTGALLWTGWTFATDSMSAWEVSFTEWGIQYWTVKLALPLGAALVLLQGIAKVLRDLGVAMGWEA